MLYLVKRLAGSIDLCIARLMMSNYVYLLWGLPRHAVFDARMEGGQQIHLGRSPLPDDLTAAPGGSDFLGLCTTDPRAARGVAYGTLPPHPSCIERTDHPAPPHVFYKLTAVTGPWSQG